MAVVRISYDACPPVGGLAPVILLMPLSFRLSSISCYQPFMTVPVDLVHLGAFRERCTEYACLG